MMAMQFVATVNLMGMTYDEIKAKCFRERRLFEDHEFHADDSSLYYAPTPEPSGKYIWRRPKEIANSFTFFTKEYIPGDRLLYSRKYNKPAAFIVDGVNRFDVKQGRLGNCWMLAALSCLSMRPDLVMKVVPYGQSFQDGDYAGVFCFKFWNFGKWVDVIIDDRLPTDNEGFVYASSSEKTEFWTALLEKAYAKLYGSYQALDGGFMIEAMEDFTGGIGECYTIGREAPSNLWGIMAKADAMKSLICCSTYSDPYKRNVLPNGLVPGHAYSVTGVTVIPLELNFQQSYNLAMVRVRNPWGNETEWKGNWSDDSPNWDLIPLSEKQRIGYTPRADGEFWMSFEEFVNNFEGLDICHLDPDALSDDTMELTRRRWALSCCEGSWIRETNAGGHIRRTATAWKNPQYSFNVVDVDDDNKDAGTVIIALMQKDRRKKRLLNLEIGYAIYELGHSASAPLGQNFNFANVPTSQVKESKLNAREVCGRHELRPGSYCVVVFAEPAGEEADFLLRVLNQKPVISRYSEAWIPRLTYSPMVRYPSNQTPSRFQALQPPFIQTTSYS